MNRAEKPFRIQSIDKVVIVGSTCRYILTICSSNMVNNPDLVQGIGPIGLLFILTGAEQPLRIDQFIFYWREEQITRDLSQMRGDQAKQYNRAINS